MQRSGSRRNVWELLAAFLVWAIASSEAFVRTDSTAAGRQNHQGCHRHRAPKIMGVSSTGDDVRTAVVLVDPVTDWKQVVKAALELGHVVVTAQMPDVALPAKFQSFLPTADALREAGVEHTLSMMHRDVFSIVQQLQVLAARFDLRVVGVIPLSEVAVEFSDLVASCLGLPHNPLGSMTARRDKGLMKDAVGRGGLRVAKHARVGSFADLRTAMTRMSLDYPIVVKTPSGMSTTDVFICSNETESNDALSSIVGKVGPDGRTTPAALLEEYIGGEEFAINLMAFEGSHLLVTDMWKYSKTNKARYEHAEICNPAEHPHLISYAREVAKAVGVEYGAAHVELKAEQAEDGQYLNPVMIEVGARLCGGLKSTMAKEAIDNWNPFTSLIESHCGGQSRSKIEEEFLTPSQYVRHIFLPIEMEGIIKDVRMVDASHLTTLHTMAMIVKPGDHVKATTDIVSCAGFVWLVGARDQVENDAHLVLSSFSILLDD